MTWNIVTAGCFFPGPAASSWLLQVWISILHSCCCHFVPLQNHDWLLGCEAFSRQLDATSHDGGVGWLSCDQSSERVCGPPTREMACDCGDEPVCGLAYVASPRLQCIQREHVTFQIQAGIWKGFCYLLLIRHYEKSELLYFFHLHTLAPWMCCWNTQFWAGRNIARAACGWLH